MAKEDNSPPFKLCPKCGQAWESCVELLTDPEVRLLGYQPRANGHRDGFFMFNHTRCDTSFGVSLPSFKSLCPLPLLSSAQGMLPNAPEFCLAARERKPCPSECVCAFVQKVSLTIRNWPKAGVHL